jgi:hypothetical protein
VPNTQQDPNPTLELTPYGRSFIQYVNARYPGFTKPFSSSTVTLVRRSVRAFLSPNRLDRGKKGTGLFFSHQRRTCAYIDGQPTLRVRWLSKRTPVPWCHLCFRSVLLFSRRLWPAPMTAPLAAFPPMAPIAAPFAAPLALGWELFWVCVAAGGVCAGGVCANAAGTTAPESAIRRDITLAECFIKASFWSQFRSAMRFA